MKKKLIFLVLFNLLCFSFFAQTQVQPQAFSRQLADLINGLRMSEGLSYLTYDEDLEKLAAFYSDLMASTKQMRHDLITDNELFHEAYQYGITYGVTELLVSVQTPNPHAYTCYRALFRSPPHKEGMLTEDGTRIGIAFSSAASRAYVTVYIGKESEYSRRASP